jgi:replicative DNA helicase
MILSCLLINSDAIEVTIRNIPIDAFYFQNHQEIYRAIFMYRNKAPIDILTLITFLQDTFSKKRRQKHN